MDRKNHDPQQVSCGLYRTTAPIGDAVPAGALVYYHSHGDPGPGVYLPREWKHNRALFHDRGTTVPDAAYARTLTPLPPEGFYRVVQAFYCCDRRCKLFDEHQLVQLGYNGRGQAILFAPELVEGALIIPDKGTTVDDWKLSSIAVLKVPVVTVPQAPEAPGSEGLN